MDVGASPRDATLIRYNNSTTQIRVPASFFHTDSFYYARNGMEIPVWEVFLSLRQVCKCAIRFHRCTCQYTIDTDSYRVRFRCKLDSFLVFFIAHRCNLFESDVLICCWKLFLWLIINFKLYINSVAFSNFGGSVLSSCFKYLTLLFWNLTKTKTLRFAWWDLKTVENS